MDNLTFAHQQMNVKFLHTSDWQLGMTRHFLSEGAQERFTQARFDAIRTLGRIAAQERCQFILVCGDAFESNQVDRKTVARAMEALKDVPVPVYLLPGNHDPLNAASVFRSSVFLDRKPPNVHVIENSDPIRVAEGVEVLGATWASKRPSTNPVTEALRALPPPDGSLRICAAHGAVDLLVPESEDPCVIEIAPLELAVEEGKIHFVALGHSHSATRIGATGRICYSGTPECTDFAEAMSGVALIVDLEEAEVSIREVEVGRWRFMERKRVDVNTLEDVEALRGWLEKLEHKERTVLRLHLVGSLPLLSNDVLRGYLRAAGDVFAALDIREEDFLVIPNEDDFADLGFSGFAGKTVERLRGKIAEGGDQAVTARDALMLLLRFARRSQ